MKLKKKLSILRIFLILFLPVASATWSLPRTIAQTTARDFFKQGLNNLVTNNYRGAVADFTQAIQLDRHFSDAYAFRCQARTQLLELTEAIADCNQALEIDPDSAIAYFNRGDARADLQDIGGAIDDFSAVIQRNPLNQRILAEAYLRRGASRAYYFGEKEEGLRDIQTAARLFRQQGNNQDYQRAIDVLDVLERRD